MRADRYLEDGRIDAAIAELDAAIVLDASAVLHHMRARAYLEKGDAERAIADFDSAIVEGGETPVALTARANRQEAVEALRAAGKPVPPPPSLDEPESGTRQAARAGLAESGEQAKSKQQVEGEQQQAALEQPKIAAEPPRPEPWPKARIDEVLSAANELLTEKKYEEIVATLEPLIERNPDTAVAWVIRGRANLELESYDRSISDLGRALELLPDHVVVLSLRAQAYERSAQNRAAIEDLTRIIDSGSDDWAIWFRRGLAYKALKDNGNAIGDLTTHQIFLAVMNLVVIQGFRFL
jgi:tetratricopeptide (TPR) repeat protein